MSYLVFALDRGSFFGLLLLGLLGLVVAYFIFMVIRSFVTIFSDMMTNRDLDRLAQEFSQKRKESAAAAERRLNNGCEHSFDDQGGALPPDVCSKCGIARTKPADECDHVWRVMPGVIPQSQCEQCGTKFNSVKEG